MISPSKDHEPPANSPEDLGYVTVEGVTINQPRGAMTLEDAHRFVEWLKTTNYSIEPTLTPGRVYLELHGFTAKDLRWLCLAIKQAGRAPAAHVMRAARLANDVALLRTPT